MGKPKIVMINSMDMAGAIGNGNELIFRFSSDLKQFKQITTGHSIIMGRKTYDSIGRPLPNRQNIVLSRQNLEIEGVVCVSSIEDAVNAASDYDSATDNIFIIGGGQIYKEFLPMTDGLYITHVPIVVNEADTFFPEFRKDFKPVSSKILEVGEKDTVTSDTKPNFILQVYYERSTN